MAGLDMLLSSVAAARVTVRKPPRPLAPVRMFRQISRSPLPPDGNSARFSIIAAGSCLIDSPVNEIPAVL